jgi:ribonuclease HI
MELQAVLIASHLFPAEEPCILYSDSKYVIDGITDQIYMWLRTNWRTSANRPLQHLEMWKELYDLSLTKQIDFRWVKGHSGDAGNDRADELALQGRMLLQPIKEQE